MLNLLVLLFALLACSLARLLACLLACWLACLLAWLLAIGYWRHPPLPPPSPPPPLPSPPPPSKPGHFCRSCWPRTTAASTELRNPALIYSAGHDVRCENHGSGALAACLCWLLALLAVAAVITVMFDSRRPLVIVADHALLRLAGLIASVCTLP